jgi:hypothetical protein
MPGSSRPRFVAERRQAKRGVRSLFGGNKHAGRSVKRILQPRHSDDGRAEPLISRRRLPQGWGETAAQDRTDTDLTVPSGRALVRWPGSGAGAESEHSTGTRMCGGGCRGACLLQHPQALTVDTARPEGCGNWVVKDPCGPECFATQVSARSNMGSYYSTSRSPVVPQLSRRSSRAGARQCCCPWHGGSLRTTCRSLCVYALHQMLCGQVVKRLRLSDSCGRLLQARAVMLIMLLER